MPDRVLLRGGVHEIVISRSRFRAALARVPDEAAATAFVAGVRREHWTATHHCTAWRLGVGGARSRSADDGEPAGTAGVPMLEVLARRGLTDSVAVVSRWFGGTKLGAGGLVRAYGRAVADAVDAGRVEHALRAAGDRIASVDHGAAVTITVHVPEPSTAAFTARLAALTAGATVPEPVGKVLLDVTDVTGRPG